MLGKSDKMCSIERSDVYLVNESSKLESVNRVHEIGEKSHSLLDHPRSHFFGHFSGWIEGNLCAQLLLQFNTDTFETLQTL